MLMLLKLYNTTFLKVELSISNVSLPVLLKNEIGSLNVSAHPPSSLNVMPLLLFTTIPADAPS